MTEAAEHIRWMRREFGPRGEKWDYDGVHYLINILISDEKCASFYTLKYPQQAISTETD